MSPGDEWLDRLVGGRYRVKAWLSSDGAHTFLAAVQVAGGRAVTLKILRPDAACEGFEALGQRLVAMRSPWLVPILDAGTCPSTATKYVVMDPLAGATLQARPSGPLRDELLVARGVLCGLGVLHDAGIVHGDVRPETILIDSPSDGLPRVTLLDGLSRVTTPHRAPEGAIDARSDLYALGSVLRERVSMPPAPLTALLEWCTAADPAQRYQSAAEALLALDDVLAAVQPDATTVELTGTDFADNAAVPTAGRHVRGDVIEEAHVRQLVVAALSALGKAFRSFAIYPENSPMLAQSAEEVCRHLDAFFARHDRLDLWVDRFALRYKRVRVYEDADVRGSYPFRLYNDGIRKLTFCAGLTRDEMFDYLGCLRHAAAPGNPTFDLVTIMWEKRFPHVFCRMVEDLVPPPKDDMSALLGTNEGGSAWYGVERAGRPPPVPDFSGRRAVPVEAHLGREDVAVLAEMTREESQGDDVLQYVAHLIAALALCAGTPDQDLLKLALGEALRAVADRRDYGHLLQIVLTMRGILASAPSEDVRIDLAALIAKISGGRDVDRMLESLRRSEDTDEVIRIAQLLAELDPQVVEPIVDRLDTIPPERVGYLQMTLLVHCEKRPWQLAPGIRCPRPQVARAIVRVLRQIPGARAANELHGALVHDAAEVRIDALQALLARSDEKLPELLPALLRDGAPAVRSAALLACGALGAGDAARLLGPLLSAPDLRLRPRDELTSLFRVLAEVGRDEATAALAALVLEAGNERWRDRVRAAVTQAFGQGEKDPVFELAVRALLQIESPSAQEALAAARQLPSKPRRKLVARLCAMHERRVS